MDLYCHRLVLGLKWNFPSVSAPVNLLRCKVFSCMCTGEKLILIMHIPSPQIQKSQCAAIGRGQGKTAEARDNRSSDSDESVFSFGDNEQKCFLGLLKHAH